MLSRRSLRAAAAAFFLAAIWAGQAQAQSALSVGGALTGGHLLMSSGGRAMDAGGPTTVGGAPQNSTQPGTRPTGMGIVNSGMGHCQWSAYASGPYSELCTGFDGSGNGLITLDGIGGAGSKTLNIKINGTSYPFPSGGTGSGNVVGPGSATVGRMAIFNATSGQLLSDNANTITDATLTRTIAGPGSGSPMTKQLSVDQVITGAANNASTANEITISSDQLNVGTGASNYLYGLWVNDVTTTPAIGGRVALQSNLNLTAGISATSGTPFNVALAGVTNAYGADGSGIGQVFGGNFAAHLKPGASGYSELIGLEINADGETGAGAPSWSIGLQIVKDVGATVQGVVLDSALAIGTAPASGITPAAAPWIKGITFGDTRTYWPISPGGTLIDASIANFAGSPAKQAVAGINFTGVAFSGFVILHDNFDVQGTGTVDANAVSPKTGDTWSVFDHGNGTAFKVVGPGTTIANFIQVTAPTTGNPPIVQALGSDTNINLALQAKGTGQVQIVAAPTVAAGTGKSFACMDTNGLIYRGTGVSCN